MSIRTWAWYPTMGARPTCGWPISGNFCTSRAFWRSRAAGKRPWCEIRCARRISTGSVPGPISRTTRGSTFSSTPGRDRNSTGLRPSCCWPCARGLTGKWGGNPVAVALPRRDAYILGQWGDQCGDVVFAWDHGYVSGYYGQWRGIAGGGCVGAPNVFGAHHGGFLPTQSEASSSFGSWLLAGPGVKRGYERPVDKLGYIHAVDVVPTFCRILGAEPPRQAQGNGGAGSV